MPTVVDGLHEIVQFHLVVRADSVPNVFVGNGRLGAGFSGLGRGVASAASDGAVVVFFSGHSLGLGLPPGLARFAVAGCGVSRKRKPTFLVERLVVDFFEVLDEFLVVAPGAEFLFPGRPQLATCVGLFLAEQFRRDHRIAVKNLVPGVARVLVDRVDVAELARSVFCEIRLHRLELCLPLRVFRLEVCR